MLARTLFVSGRPAVTVACQTCLPDCRWPSFCYYVTSEAIANRKYSYMLYSQRKDKLWHVEKLEKWHACHARALSHTHTHLFKHEMPCSTPTNHLSPFIMSDSLFDRRAPTDTDMYWSLDCYYTVSANAFRREVQTCFVFFKCVCESRSSLSCVDDCWNTWLAARCRLWWSES